ncbi:O-antigen ligase family protein [Litchfieldella rifensis]|uniref:O-antigen ligase family protein n=1 Tax=Litchfieldella rifensis TaxID=762643 RepID=A0ABV7LU76_9GAMM
MMVDGKYLPVSSVWQRLNTWLLFAFVALLIVVPWGYAVVPLLVAIVALMGWAAFPRSGSRSWGLDVQDGGWCLALLAFSGVWLLDVWRTGYWPVGEENQGVALPLWPLLAILLLIWLRRYPPSIKSWWLSVGCAALAVGAIALFERWVLGHDRASNGINSIPFGNLSLLMGVLSLVALLWLMECQRWNRNFHAIWLYLALAAVLAGTTASLLSGTRGGWIAMPLLLLLIFRTYREVLSKLYLRLTGGAILGLVLLVALLPQSGVTQRLAETVADVQQYWTGESTNGSVGVRLELWRGGVVLFSQAPLLGWGEGRMEAARDEMVAEGTLAGSASEHDQLHSDIIDTAARRGMLGLMTLGMLYGMPLYLFARFLRHPDPDIRALALAGVLIPVAFIDFGLTQSMLRDVRGLAGYLGLSVGLWAVLKGKIAEYAISA